METENKFWLKYIIIPVEVLMNEELTSAEMKLFGLIDVLDGPDGCFAGNEYMASILNLTQTTISTGISKLKKQKYIKQESFNGRVRVIKIDPAYKQAYNQTLSQLKGRVKASLKQKNINEDDKGILSLPKGKDKDESRIRHRPFLNTSSSPRPAKTPDILPRQKLPKTQLAYENASGEARDIIDAWNDLPTTSTHRKSSKSVKEVLKLLDSKLLKKYGMGSIKRCIIDFSMMQLHAKLYNVPASKTRIDAFFMSNGYLTHYKKQRGQQVEPPWFDKLILPGSFKNYMHKTEPNRELTSEFKRMYEKHIAGEAPEFYTPKQEGQFITASGLLKRCMDRGRLGECIDGAGVVDYILHFLRALDEEWGASKIRVWHLSTVDSWNSVFPRYITRHWKEI